MSAPYRDSLEALRDRTRQLQKDLASAEAECENIKDELPLERRKRLRDLRAAIDERTSTVEELSNQVALRQRYLDLLQHSVAAVRDEVERLKNEARDLESQLTWSRLPQPCQDQLRLLKERSPSGGLACGDLRWALSRQRRYVEELRRTLAGR